MRLALANSLAIAALAACSAPSPTMSEPAPVDADRTLCMSAGPAAATPASEALKKAQASKGRLADNWVSIGQAWVHVARDESDPGAYIHSAACAELALKMDARHRGAKNLLLLSMLNDHRFREAKVLATAMLEEDPSDQMGWGSLSDALLELGDIAGATEAAQKMVDLRPNLPSYARASYLAWLQGDVESAKLYIREAHRAGRGQRLREPEAWVLTQAALLFWHEGDLDGADAGYDFALKQRPGYPDALVGKAQIALAKGQANEAVVLLESALVGKPATKTLWLLGDARKLAGDDAGAAEAFAELRRVGRTQDPLTFGLFLATTSDDDADKELAVELLGREVSERAGLYTRSAYAFALARVGRASEAQPLVDELIALGTPDAELLWRAGVVRLAGGRVKEGLALQVRAASLNPTVGS